MVPRSCKLNNLWQNTGIFGAETKTKNPWEMLAYFHVEIRKCPKVHFLGVKPCLWVTKKQFMRKGTKWAIVYLLKCMTPTN